MHFAFKIAMVAFVLSGLNNLPAQEKQSDGFRKIPFGTAREEWLTSMKSRYKMKPSFPLGEQWPMSGSGMNLYMTSDSVYCLTDYILGHRSYTVLFYFNSDNKFYGFRLKGDKDKRPGTASAGQEQMCESGLTGIETKNLLEDVQFLQKVFEVKYGNPTRVLKYDTDEICRNAEKIFWIQKSGRHLAVIGSIGTVYSDGRNHNSVKYTPVAVMYDPELMGKPAPGATLFSLEGSPRLKEEQKIVEKAAESF